MNNHTIIKGPNSSVSVDSKGNLIHKSSHRGFPTKYWIDHVAMMEKKLESIDDEMKPILTGMLALDRAALQDALDRDARK